MEETITILAGDCTIVDDGPERGTIRGRVVTVVKPDNTVLVHDVSGYQPVAWLTRADTVRTADRDGELPALVARKDGRELRVSPHAVREFEWEASPAGPRIGVCPDCASALVRDGDALCIGCPTRYGLPADAEVLDQRCGCGLPRMRVERGRAFDICIDRGCESLDDAVRAAFDRKWDCPTCGESLRIIRRGGLMAGCGAYPQCDVGFALPAGVIDGYCPCGLPTFGTGTGRRCLDPACDAWLAGGE